VKYLGEVEANAQAGSSSSTTPPNDPQLPPPAPTPTMPLVLGFAATAIPQRTTTPIQFVDGFVAAAGGAGRDSVGGPVLPGPVW
jgi:hypothetical protein